MKSLHIELAHCYGIKALQHTFDFSTRKAYAVYAANGAMKSSFAQVFKDIAERRRASRRSVFAAYPAFSRVRTDRSR
jgi:hypothetical protein